MSTEVDQDQEGELEVTEPKQTPKRTVRKKPLKAVPAPSPKKKKKAVAKEAAVAKPSKKGKKAKKSVKSPTPRNDRGLTDDAQKVIDYLGKVGATKEQTAVAREKVWSHIGSGKEDKRVVDLCARLRRQGLIAWSGLEERAHPYYLTPEGKKLISKKQAHL